MEFNVDLTIEYPNQVFVGEKFDVSWTAFNDIEDVAGYELYRCVNDGSWTKIFEEKTSISTYVFTDTAQSAWHTVMYRVRAYNAEGTYSGYGSIARWCTVNSALVITCEEAEDGGDLGEKSAPFSVTVEVVDLCNEMSVWFAVDDRQKDGPIKHYQYSGSEEESSFTIPVTAEIFYGLTNGSHTLTITVEDDVNDPATYTLNFIRQVSEAIVTLETPFDADGQITTCALEVDGDIPDDVGYFSAKVTNNAKDDTPTWEDCTAAVKNGSAYSFQNETAENGFSFNFRVRVCRGANDIGGYIKAVRGGFQ